MIIFFLTLIINVMDLFKVAKEYAKKVKNKSVLWKWLNKLREGIISLYGYFHLMMNTVFYTLIFKVRNDLFQSRLVTKTKVFIATTPECIKVIIF